MPRAFTNTAEIEADLLAALRILREALDPQEGTPVDDAFAHVETFSTLALRVFRKTNPSKIRSEAMTLEIAARMSGREVLEPSSDQLCNSN